MTDLTILYLTLNKLPEGWMAYHKKVLLEAVGDTPIITISKKPMDWGINILQTEPESLSNIYWQMLKAGKIATTPFVAIVEDDTLYSKEHFAFRDPTAFSYNMTHWSLFTWGEPTYSWRDRTGNYSMISSRQLMIDALEERFAKWPNGTPKDITGELGRDRVNRNLGLSKRKLVEYFTTIGIVNFNHDYSEEEYQRTHVKRMGPLRAYDIPFWGKASELVKNFK